MAGGQRSGGRCEASWWGARLRSHAGSSVNDAALSAPGTHIDSEKPTACSTRIQDRLDDPCTAEWPLLHLMSSAPI